MPATPDDLAKAHSALEANYPDEAIAILEKLATEQPQKKGIQHQLGVAYYQTGKFIKAKAAFELSLKEDASDQESTQLLGLTLYSIGQPAAAIPYLEHVRQWMPSANSDANHVLGLCYMQARRYDDARHAFARQYDEAPDSAEAYLITATVFLHANLPEGAAEQAQKAVTISPNLPLAHFMLGQVALYKSNVTLAISEFEAERRINPGFAPVYDRLADSYLHINKLTEAQQSLTKSLSLDTSSTGPFILMGEVMLRSDTPLVAILYLKHAEKMDPSNYTTHTLLAQAYRRTGQEDAAKQEMEVVSKIHVDSQLRLDSLK